MRFTDANETKFEYETDIILGLAFLGTTIVAGKRMAWSQSQGGAETTVVTAFYSLILMTSALRAIWFLIPKSSLEPSYTPSATMAFSVQDDGSSTGWIGTFISEMLVSIGSLCLFSIFILILVYWADILKKYFYPGARRTKPMVTFLTLVTTLGAIILINAALFLFKIYSSEAMLLVNALLLALVSIVCVCEITVFSNKFRTVLMTLGAINQVSTESQVKRIMWITVTGNLFFATRALLELAFSLTLIVYWYRHGNVDEVVTHTTWDAYIWLKHLSEVAILCLMLYILQSRFTTSTPQQQQQQDTGATAGRGEYQPVPDAVDEEVGGDNDDAEGKAVVV